MKKTITLSLLCFLFTAFIFAQQQRECAVMENLKLRKQQDPKLEARMAQIEAFTKSKVREFEAQDTTNRSINGDIITIPVVVHVLYRNDTENISAAQIQSQIDVLNEDFRRTNSDANNVWSQGSDTQIEFCLSTVDPNGNATTGITRKSTTRRDWGTNDEMKSTSSGGVNPWNTSEYLNMWIVPQMLRSNGGTILGYAQFPGGSAATDGCVMAYNYFGRTGAVSAPFDKGRTTTHEIGHYFNLRHIWGDANCGNDQVSDTPTAQGPNYGCDTGNVSCNSTDMVQNYMDYSDDACMNLFTTGQKNRMRSVLAAGGARRTLALSSKCGAVVQPTCNDGIQNGNETGVDCGGSCTPCQTGNQYCDSQGNSVADEYISRVQVGSINKSSGAQLYSDFTSTSTDLNKGDSYTLTVTPTWTGTLYNEGYAAWIDYNDDGDFTDSGEQIFSKSASKTAPVSGTFTVPSGTVNGNKRLRVSMKYNGVPSSCETFSYGEVEDYTVNIKTGTTPQDKCEGVSPWSGSINYSAGDKVTYQGTLYEKRSGSGWNSLGACGSARITEGGFVKNLGVDITVYPNPVKGNTLFVKSNVENLPFTIVNMLGQQVAKGTSSIGVNVSNLNSGLYMIQFNVNDKLETRKFIKQ